MGYVNARWNAQKMYGYNEYQKPGIFTHDLP